MLVLSRKLDQQIAIGPCAQTNWETITVMVTEIRGDKVRLGFVADRTIPIHRQEVADAIARDAEDAA